MKYALISDVHGNYPALCAVLSDAREANVDKYIFVGDYYMCFPYPNEVVDLIKTHPNSIVVRGNEEDRMEALSGRDKSTWVDGQFQALYWYYDALTDDNRAYLTGLPRHAGIDERLHVSHWSSTFIGNVEMEKFSTYHLHRIFGNTVPSKEELLAFISEKLQSDEGFQMRLNELEDGIYIFGHSHVQWHQQYGGKYFINPGSCGFPLDFSGGAPYTILELANGAITVEKRRIAYDESKCVNDLLSSPLYKQEKVWNEIIIKEFHAHREFLMYFLVFVEEYANKTGDDVRPYSKQTWAEAYSIWQHDVF